jgi:hypothetical protein
MTVQEQSVELGGHPNVPFELGGKMKRIGKTRQESDFLDRHGGAGQKASRPLKSQLQQVLDRRTFHVFQKETVEMGWTDIDVFTDLLPR